MRRILLLAIVSVMVAVAGPASATIHSLSCTDRSAGHAAEGSTAATQEPPGITDGDFNGDNALQRQPIVSVRANDTAEANAIGNKDPVNGGDCKD